MVCISCSRVWSFLFWKGSLCFLSSASWKDNTYDGWYRWHCDYGRLCTWNYKSKTVLTTMVLDQKNFGSLWYFLGIEVARSKKRIFMSRKKYLLDTLSEGGLSGCRGVHSLMETNVNKGTWIILEDVKNWLERSIIWQWSDLILYLQLVRKSFSFSTEDESLK